MQMPLMELLRTRRSVRRYSPRAIDRAGIETLLEAMVLAPSAHNRQPWRAIVVTSPASRAALAEAMAERLIADRRADGDPEDLVQQDAARSRTRLKAARCVIALFADMTEMDRYPDAARRNAEHLMAVQSVAMAGHNILLAAHAAGLGACWMCAPLFCPDVVATALKPPPEWQPQALLTLGWPDGAPTTKPRKSWRDLVRFE